MEKYEHRIENGRFKSPDARENFIDEIILTCFRNSRMKTETDIKNVTWEIMKLLPNEERVSDQIKPIRTDIEVVPNKENKVL